MADLQQFVGVGEWLDHNVNPFFQTRAALDWFIKRHREELVEQGALIPRAGRNGSLLHSQLFPRLVISILKREAQERAAAA
jgi:hypothetical protein